MKAFLDSSAVIHASEDTVVGERLRKALDSETTEARFVVSPLVKLESLVRPLRNADELTLDRRMSVLDNCVSHSIHDRAFELATHIRVRHGLETADAVHLATASLSDCQQLWTSDRRILRAAPGFAVDVTSEF